jgi:hypothetical protein
MLDVSRWARVLSREYIRGVLSHAPPPGLTACLMIILLLGRLPQDLMQVYLRPVLHLRSLEQLAF